MDEEVFADGVVTHFGQIVGVVLAESQPLAQRAAQTVSITYDDLPSVITIEVRETVLGGMGYSQGWSVASFPDYQSHSQTLSLIPRLPVSFPDSLYKAIPFCS